MAENQIVTGHFEADGALINLPIGFTPDYFYMIGINGTIASSVKYQWWQDMATAGDSALVEGFIDTAGTYTDAAVTEGISAYGTRTDLPSIATWTEAGSTAATARSATTAGTYVRPTTSGTVSGGMAADRSLIFECVTAGTGASTEPVWPIDGPQGTQAGGQVTDGSTVWERVVEPTFSAGYQGVTIAAAIQTDGEENFYYAFRSNTSKDRKDVVGWASGVSPDVL